MAAQTPTLMVLQAAQALNNHQHSNGSVSFTFTLPDYDIREPHAIKLLFVIGAAKPVICQSNLVAPQLFNGQLFPLIGTSVQYSNVYVPVRNNWIGGTIELNFRSLSGGKLEKAENLVIGLHLAPIKYLALWGHRC